MIGCSRLKMLYWTDFVEIMKMSIKGILKLLSSAVLSSVCLQSCIYDGIAESPDCPAGADGKYYMSLRFDLREQHRSGALTRTFLPSYEDEDYEREVTDFRIFLVKRDDPDAAVIELEDIPMVDEVTTEPFEINPKYIHGYLLYVVANSAGSGFSPDLSSGRAFRGTYKPANAAVCSQIWSKNNFLMVNVNNEASDRDTYIAMREGDPVKEFVGIDPLPVADDPTPDGGVPVEIDESKTYSLSNPYRVNVTLERVAAKIVVDCSEENFDFKGSAYYNDFHDVRVTGVALINAANSFNLIQQWKVACYQGPKYFNYEWEIRRQGKWGNEAIPTDSPYGYPYLWAVTPMSEITTVPSEIYYNRVADFTDFANQKLRDGADKLFTPIDAATGTATLYCLENTSPLYLDFMSNFQKGIDNVQDKTLWKEILQEGMRNRVTGVLFRVRAKIKDDSHSSGDLIQDPDKGVWTKSGADDYRTFYGYEKAVYPRLEELINEKPELKSKINASSSVKQLRDAGVKVYEDGYMYYVHWIVDQNYEYMWNYPDEADEGEAFSCKAVLRNTRYVVKVKSVKELGMDLPGRYISTNYWGTTLTLQGSDYMLAPTNSSSISFDINDYLPYLKNTAL